MASEPAGWPTGTVDSLMDAIIDYRGKTPKKTTSGVPLVTAKLIKNGRIKKATEFIAADDYDNWMRRGLPKVGDVLITTEAPLGEVAQLRSADVALAQRVILLRGREQTLNNTFLKFALQSRPVQAELHARSSGTTVLGIKQRELRKVSLPLPPLDEQWRIAAVLGALDDKIELNRKMNRTLEEMAQAIFKSWFIDFDGVPDSEMVERELGPIPKGWEVKPVNEIIQFNPRTRLVKGTLATFVDMRALPTTGCSVSGVVKKVLKSGGAKFMRGDILLARITPCLENGKTALVDFLASNEVAFGSTEFIVMRPTGPLGREWVYCLARSAEFRQHATSNMTGSSGRQRVPIDCFSHFAMPEPPATVAKRFEAVTSPLFDRIKANADESRTLAHLRDALLPKLISGAVRVPEADEPAEVVV